ncbi:inositol monophosphatase family protein [Ornithinimicrobium pekingense]|uniref:Inositol-1-monophosphatase n=1 Tax=Ornithinimicrobium pekingense TaxID=384677 RepID=A0ABQ2FB46_9MICO|nr:inositol monophosphatase family protein [Ornithinimicrobium pekingense]GGK70343.1 inositol monophosphatase [Ornithinimicrobium pekingense]
MSGDDVREDTSEGRARPGAPRSARGAGSVDPLRVPEEDRAALERLAVAMALEAGRLIGAGRPARIDVHRTKSTDLDVVTVMDERAEALLRERIAAERPDDAVLGEEGAGVSPGTTGLTWVLDPIDGTVNYLYGLPAYAVSVAVVVGDPSRAGAWAPVAGAVVNPSTGELFHARAGGGAYLRRVAHDGTLEHRPPERLEVTDVDDLGQVLLATGFSYDRGRREGQAAVTVDLLPRVRDLRRMGAAALDLCHVAAGRVDAYFEWGTHPWDFAAGVLVVTEAGGVVSGLAEGSAPSRAMVVAAGASAHALVRAELARLEAGDPALTAAELPG